MPLQLDLPDFHSGRVTTSDPIVNINQAVSPTAYDSGILDVGQFTQLLVSAVTQVSNAVFRLDLTFYVDSLGAITVKDFAAFAGYPGFVTDQVYPIPARYCRVQASEITATGGAVVLAVVPSSGPAQPFVLPTSVGVVTDVLVASGTSTQTSPSSISRGLWRVWFATRSLHWELDVQVAEGSAVWTNQLSITDRTASPPLMFDLRLPPTVIRLQLTNLWAYSARFIAWIAQVSN